MRDRQFYHRADPTWCRGCGLFGIFDAFKRAAAAHLTPTVLAVVGKASEVRPIHIVMNAMTTSVSAVPLISLAP